MNHSTLLQQVMGLRQQAVAMTAYCDGIIAQLVEEDIDESASKVQTMGQSSE